MPQPCARAWSLQVGDSGGSVQRRNHAANRFWYNEAIPLLGCTRRQFKPMSDFLRLFIAMLFQVLSLAILGRVLLSWIDPLGNMRITQVLRDLTEPILAPIRNLLPNMAMFDFSPIIAMLLLQALGRLILSAIR